MKKCHKNDSQGTKPKKFVKKSAKVQDVNEVIGLLTKFQHTSDKALGELAAICQKR